MSSIEVTEVVEVIPPKGSPWMLKVQGGSTLPVGEEDQHEKRSKRTKAMKPEPVDW